MSKDKGFSEQCVDRELDGDLTLRGMIEAKDFTNPAFVNVMRDVSGVQAVTRILEHMKHNIGHLMRPEMALLISTILPILTNASCASLAVMHASDMQSEPDMDMMSIRTGGTRQPIMAEIGSDLAKVIGLIDGNCVAVINDPVLEMYVIVPTEAASLIMERSAPKLKEIQESRLYQKYKRDKAANASLDSDHPLHMILNLALVALQAEATSELEPIFDECKKEFAAHDKSKTPSFVAPSTDTVQ